MMEPRKTENHWLFNWIFSFQDPVAYTCTLHVVAKGHNCHTRHFES